MAQMRGGDVGKDDVFGLRNEINESYFAVYSRTLRCRIAECNAVRLLSGSPSPWLSPGSHINMMDVASMGCPDQDLGFSMDCESLMNQVQR